MEGNILRVCMVWMEFVMLFTKKYLYVVYVCVNNIFLQQKHPLHLNFKKNLLGFNPLALY